MSSETLAQIGRVSASLSRIRDELDGTMESAALLHELDDAITTLAAVAD